MQHDESCFSYEKHSYKKNRTVENPESFQYFPWNCQKCLSISLDVYFQWCDTWGYITWHLIVKLWQRWKDKNAIPDVSTSPRCCPTHVTSLPNESEATRLWFLTPIDKTCFKVSELARAFGCMDSRTRRGRRAVCEGNSRSCPRYSFTHHKI